MIVYLALLLGCAEGADGTLGADGTVSGGTDGSVHLANTDSGENPKALPRAVVIVVDGARTDETVGEGGAEIWPRVRALAAQGAQLSGARNTGVTLTVDAHAELATGRRQALANYSPGNYGAWRPDVPTLVELVTSKRGMGRDQAVVLGNTLLLAESFASRYPGLGYAYAPDMEVLSSGGQVVGNIEILEALQAQLDAADIQIAFVNLHLADAEAHAGRDYTPSLNALDAPLADLWEWIQTTERYGDQTTYAIIADHGRHRTGEEDDWFHHGDSCNGCRELPAYILGPDIAGETVVSRPVSLSDLAATLAWRLGVALPYGDGVVVPELADGTPPQRGERLGAIAGERQAVQRWVDEEDRRTEVLVDGTVLSSAEALHAEAPRLLALEGGDLACWRELTLKFGTFDLSSWEGRCAREVEGAWTPDNLPERAGSSAWFASLATDEAGRAWLADTSNYEGYPDLADVRPRVFRSAGPSAWESDPLAGPELTYPTDLELHVLSQTQALVALTAGADPSAGRDSRRIEVWSVEWPAGAAQAWTRVAALAAPADAVRLERPALFQTESGWQLVALSWPLAGGISVVAAEGDPAGKFGDWTQVEAGSRVLGNVAPRFGPDGTVHYARRGDDGILEHCAGQSSDVECSDVPVDALDGLFPGEAGTEANVATEWTWEVRTL